MDRRVKERLVGATILVVLIVLIVPELLSGPKRKATPPPVTASPEEPAGRPAVRNVTVDLLAGNATPEAETAAASAAASTPASPSASGDAPSAAASPASEAESPATALEPAATDEPAPPTGATVLHRHGEAPPTIATLRAQQGTGHALENEGSSPMSPAPTPGSGVSREPAPPPVSRHGWAVQIGSFASRANAETLMHRLKAHEQSAYVSSIGQGTALRYRVRVGPLADRAAAERVQSKLMKQGHSATLVPP